MQFMIYLMPVSLLLMAWKMRNSGVVATFVKAGAISEATARRPDRIGNPHPDFVRGAARRGTLVDMGDGRYYADLQRIAQVRRRRWLLVGSAAVLTIALTAVLWHPWG